MHFPSVSIRFKQHLPGVFLHGFSDTVWLLFYWLGRSTVLPVPMVILMAHLWEDWFRVYLPCPSVCILFYGVRLNKKD